MQYIPNDEIQDSIRPAHKIDLSKARRKEIRNFARNLAGMDNPEYGATAKDYQEGFVDLGLNKRKSKFFDRVFKDQYAKNLEYTDKVNRDQQVIQAAKEGNFDPEQFGEWIALKRDESPVTQKFVMPLVTGSAFGPAMAVASLAGEATNLGTNAATGWDTWGKAFTSGRKGSWAAELTNPGYIVTGPLANGGQRLIQGWKYATETPKQLLTEELQNSIKEFRKTLKQTTFVPAQVKYYGPTMGKSYAAKTNPNLIDLDTWGRSEYDQLAKKYGYKDWREMILSDKGDYNEEYKALIKDQIRRIQSDPQYNGKTIVVSNASLLKPNSGITFANTPVIPERSVMAARNTARHPWESIEHGEEWWDSLQRKGTPLRIDNRFISDIEGNKAISFAPAPQKFVSTVHFDPRVKPMSRPISEAERLGIPKGERSNPKILEDPQYWGYKQWNQRYNDAVESGNWDEVQRLRDLHFIIKTPSEERIMMSENEPFIFAHTTNSVFNTFDASQFGKTDGGFLGKGFYFGSTVPTEAPVWSNLTFKGRRPIHNYGKNKNYFYIKGKPSQLEGSDYNYFSDPKQTISFNLDTPIHTNEFLVGHPEQIKLGDSMTFDDGFQLIPIVKRDNFNNPDIRYKSGGILKAQRGIAFVTPQTNWFTSKLIELLNNRFKTAEPNPKALADGRVRTRTKPFKSIRPPVYGKHATIEQSGGEIT